MSKIICDVCGTSYPESSEQCPICGCARPVDSVPKISNDNSKITRRENYTYVKGGRFSKANVQKRHNSVLPEKEDNQSNSKAVNTNKSDRGLVIAVCALLLAIIAVVIYIAIHFFAGYDSNNNDPSAIPSTTQTIQTTQPSTNSEIFCTEIALSQSEITLAFAGEEYSISVVLDPIDTTEEVLFASSDDSVATVSGNGNVVAVGNGEAIVTVTCGAASAQCKVICSFSEEPTVAVTEPTITTGTYTAPYKINKTDVSISVGETFLLKLSDANGELIPVIWSPAVTEICSIDGNSITGEMKGKVEVSTTYEGETYTCIVRVR